MAASGVRKHLANDPKNQKKRGRNSKLFRWTLVLFGFAIVAIATTILAWPAIQKQLITRINNQLGPNVQVSLRSSSLRPLKLSLFLEDLKIEISQPRTRIAIPQAQLKVSLKAPWAAINKHQLPFVLRVGGQNLKIQSVLAPSQAPGAAAKKSPWPKSLDEQIAKLWLPEIAFELTNSDLQIYQTKATQVLPLAFLEETDLRLQLAPPYTQIPVGIDLNLGLPQFPQNFRLPVGLQGVIAYQKGQVRCDNATIILGGAHLDIKGASQLASDKHYWHAKLNIPSLSDLPAPPEFLPPGKWKGKILAELKAMKSPQSDFQFRGKIQADEIHGAVQMKKKNLTAHGPIKGSLFVDLSYHKQLKIRSANLHLDATALNVFIPQAFHKPSQIPFVVSATGHLDNGFIQLQTQHFKFHTLQGQVSGRVPLDPQRSAFFQAQTGRVNLDGWGKMIQLPQVRQARLQGQLALDAKFSGPLRSPKKWRTEIKDLHLKDIKARWKSKTDGFTIEAQPSISGHYSAILQGQKLKQASMKGRIHIPSLSFQKTGWQEPLKSFLTWDHHISQKNDDWTVQNSQLKSTALHVSLNGKVKVKQATPWQLQLQSQIKLLKLEPFRRWFPDQLRLNTGQATAQLRVSGKYDRRIDWHQQNLDLRGKVNANLGHLQWLPSTSTSDVKAEPPQESKPLLPPWPLLRQAQLQLQTRLQTVQSKELVVKKPVLTVNLNQGELVAQGQMSVFDGSVNLQKAKLQLTEINPVIEFATSLTGLQARPAIRWLFPKGNGWLRGQVSGKAQGQLGWPLAKNFLDSTAISSHLDIKNVAFNAKRFDAQVFEFLKKIPGLAVQQNLTIAPTSTLDATVAAQLKNKTVIVDSLKLEASDRNGLQAQGQFDLQLKGLLNGTAYLSRVPLKGSFIEANQSEGRLAVPISMQGDLLSPNFSVAQGTLQKMTQNMIDYEKNKAVNTLKKRAEKEVKKQADKALEDLKDRLFK